MQHKLPYLGICLYLCGEFYKRYMKCYFQDVELEAFVSDKKNAGNKFKRYARDNRFYNGLVRVFQIISSVDDTAGLKDFSFLHYERLKHQDETIGSVRILPNRVERIIFRELNDGVEIIILELNTTHYGNKK